MQVESNRDAPRPIRGLIRRLPLILLLMMPAFACDDSPSGSGHDASSNIVVYALEFLREDETALAMGTDFAICCGIWEPDYHDETVLKLFFYDPLLWTEPDQADSFWKLFIDPDAVEIGRVYDFPTSADSPLHLFFVDATSGNELSGDEEESSGSITIQELRCGPPLRVRFSIDAIIGSEYHLAPSVLVSGNFHARIYANPSPLGCEFSL